MSFRRDELEIEVRNLYKALEGRDNVIAQLEQRLEESRNVESKDKRYSELETELDDAKREVTDGRHTISELRYIVDQYSVENEILKEDKRQLEDQLQSQQGVLESQKQKIIAAKQQSDDVRRRQRDGTDEHYRLELENRRLTEVVQELEENEEDLVSEIESIAKERHIIELQYHGKCQENETLKLALAEESGQQENLASERDMLMKKLELEQKKIKEFTCKVKNQKEEYLNHLDKLRDELEVERNKNKVLDTKAALSLGAKREQEKDSIVDDLKFELQMMQVKVQDLEMEKQQVERELEHVRRALRESRDEATFLKQDIKTKKESSNHKLKLDLENAINKENVSKALCLELETQLVKVRDELHLAEERNSWYEEEHSLCDAVKYQKKLEADIRRRDADLKKNIILLGEKDDQINLLKKLCMSMKESLGPDFEVDEDAMKEAIAIEDNQLQSQICELNRQVEELERDRVSLMKRLRENAAQISEKGIRFVGLTAPQILLLTDFARNLKDGKAELPLNDRSMELTSKLATMKAMRQSDLITIERLEREIQSMKCSNGTNEGNIDSELHVLRSMLEDIQSQNKNLRDRIETLNRNNKKDCSFEDNLNVVSPLDRGRIERVLGESLECAPQKVLNQFQCFLKEYEKLESELSIMKASMFRWSKYKEQRTITPPLKSDDTGSSTQNQSVQTIFYDGSNQLNHNGMITNSHEKHLTNSKGCSTGKTDLGKFNNGGTITFTQSERARTNFYTDINFDNNDIAVNPTEEHFSHKRCYKDASTETETLRTKHVQMQVSFLPSEQKVQNDSDLKLSQDQLRVAEAKVMRLKEALKQSISSNRYENRILIAQASIKQMKSIIDEKNRVIQKYRNRCIDSLNYRADKDRVLFSKENDDDINNIVPLGTSNMSQTTEGLVVKIQEASSLVYEKEQVIKILQNEIRLNEERTHHLEVRYKDLLEDVDNLRDSNDFLQEQLHQAALYKENMGKDQSDRQHELEVKRNDCEGMIKSLQLEINQKDEIISRLKSHNIRLKQYLQEYKENAKKVPILESEIKQIKIDLNVCRRTRDRWERAVSGAKRKEIDLTSDVEKLENQVSKLRKEICDAKHAKVEILNKSKRTAQKLKQVQESILKDQDAKKEYDECEKVEVYQKKIQALKKDNIRLRGIVASYTFLKEDNIQHEGTTTESRVKVSNNSIHRSNARKTRTNSCGDKQNYIDSTCQTDETWLLDSCHSEVCEAKQSLTYQHPDESKDVSQHYYSQTKQHEFGEEKYSSRKLRLDHNINHMDSLMNELKAELRKQQSMNKKLQIELLDIKNKYQCKISDEKNVAVQLEMIPTLRQEISHLKRKIAVASDEKCDSEKISKSKIEQVLMENDRLRKELSSFSLDFFEEIEDLKFKYSQASKRLASYDNNMETT